VLVIGGGMAAVLRHYGSPKRRSVMMTEKAATESSGAAGSGCDSLGIGRYQSLLQSDTGGACRGHGAQPCRLQ